MSNIPMGGSQMVISPEVAMAKPLSFEDCRG